MVAWESTLSQAVADRQLHLLQCRQRISTLTQLCALVATPCWQFGILIGGAKGLNLMAAQHLLTRQKELVVGLGKCIG
jgi:hypothetical protein